MAGMMSVREDGLSITGIITKHLHKWIRYPILILVVFLMIMVSATFARSASDLLVAITGVPIWVWLLLILIYFMASTLLPIDKVIGRIYPIFGILLILMGVTVIVGLYTGGYEFPQMVFENQHPTGAEFLPDMFVTVACGAISGFHATQCPMVSRCIKSEDSGRMVFYGAMIMESVLALIWATAGLSFYGDTAGLADALASGGASGVVHEIASTLAGPIGGVMAVIGVIICPITSGDTALRAGRLMIEDDRGIGHSKKIVSVAITSVMMLFIVILCCLDFSVLWNYFSWLNQTIATIVLWTATVFIMKVIEKPWYSLITMLPAMFMTMIVTSYIVYSPIGLDWGHGTSLIIGVLTSIVIFVLYLRFLITSVRAEKGIES
jgi:carbon starvation protein CstA